MAGCQTIVTESELVEFARCPLRVLGEHVYSPTEEYSAAAAVIRSSALEAFDALTRPSLNEARGAYENEWKKVSKRPINLEGAKKINGIAIRIRDLFENYNVIQPVAEYHLSFGWAYIHGACAVLEDRKKPGVQLALELYAGGEGLGFPGPVSYIRYLYAQSIQRAALGDGQPSAVLRFDVSSPRSEVFQIAEPVARERIVSLLEHWASDRFFPVPGSHCESCLTKACK